MKKLLVLATVAVFILGGAIACNGTPSTTKPNTTTTTATATSAKAP